MSRADCDFCDEESMKIAKEMANLHTIIQALNEALVKTVEKLICIDGQHRLIRGWGFDIEDGLTLASTTLALVPEADRKGGTWGLEE